MNKDFEHIILLIEEARSRVYAKANTELVLLYFNVGKIVYDKVSADNWGDNTVQELADFIKIKMPALTGFNRRGLYRMKQFFELYRPESEVFKLWVKMMHQKMSSKIIQDKAPEIDKHDLHSPIVSTVRTHLQEPDNQYNKFVSTVLTQISWSNHRLIFSKTKTAEETLYYLLISNTEKYSARELERALNTAQFERTMLSEKTVSTMPPQINLPKNLFKDPYIFEFLNLPDGHSEKDFEEAITLNLQKFILEIGKGFTYMGRQYRLQVGNKDYYTDLLFYHRDLQCLVLFELKIQEFEPDFLGKLNFYLEVLDRNVKRHHENPSVGILLCKGKDSEVVEVATARNLSPAIIADYETKLIDKKLLADKLNQLAELFNNRDNADNS